MQERALAFSMSQLIPKAVLLLLVGLVVLAGFPRGFLQLQLAFLISTIAVLLIYAWNTRKEWIPAFGAQINLAQLRILLRYSVPLIFAGLAYWGLSATSALTLRSLSSFRELGIYSVSTSFAGIAVIVQSIFSVIWAPVLYKWVANDADMSRVDRVARQGLAVVCGVFVICGMLSWLIDYALPSQYAEVKYLVMCSIAQPLLYALSEVTSVGINIMRRTMLSVWSTLVAFLTNLGLNLWLVPSFGASGAVVANAIAFLVFFVARTESSAFVWRQFPRVKLYVFTSAAIVLSVLTVILGPMTGVFFSVIWAIALPLVVWVFREEWRLVLSSFRRGILDLRKVEVDR
jgi:O-antigen/teichoic acid export membrane protein